MKKIVAIMATAALALTLCACGSSASNSAANNASNAAANNTANAAATNTNTNAQKISDAEWDTMNDAITAIVADEWAGYDYTVDFTQATNSAVVYVCASEGTKDTLLNNPSENVVTAWTNLKEGVIDQNARVKAAATAMPNLTAETYLIEGVSIDTINQAIEANGSYTPTDCLLHVKDSTVVYDVTAQ